MQGFLDSNSSKIAPPPHVEIPQDSHAIESGGRGRQRENRDICGVLPKGVAVGGMSGGRVPIEGKQLGKTQVTLNILSLEGKVCDLTGGPGATPTVQPLWDAHSGGAAG